MANILRKPQVRTKTRLSNATIDDLERTDDFPRRFRLAGRAVGWLENEIDDWIIKQAGKRPRGRRGARASAQPPEAAPDA
jgi:prophage regulatory protein